MDHLKWKNLQELVIAIYKLKIKNFLDPIKRLSQNIAVNKTLIGKCVNRMEKSKTMAYEYRSDASGNRALNSSPSLQRLNSKGDY